MTTSRFPGIMLALAAGIALIGCGKEAPPPPPPPPPPAPVAPPPKPEITVNLGHVAPMTGPQAHLGKDHENGALLAVDDLNAQKLEIGGAIVSFKLLSEDDQADPRQATVVAQKLVDAKVNGVIGHLNSGTTIPASKIYFDAGIPQISGASTNPTYTLQVSIPPSACSPMTCSRVRRWVNLPQSKVSGRSPSSTTVLLTVRVWPMNSGKLPKPLESRW